MHDAVEDAGVAIEDLPFGDAVAYIVNNLTERKETPKSERKFEYVRLVASANDSVKLISAADKLHNLRCYAADGQHLWSEETANFYAQLLPVYAGCDRVPRHWVAEMNQLLARLKGKEWWHVLHRDSRWSDSAASAVDKIHAD